MALDWIKIREDIHEDPAILKISRRLKTRPEHVVGYCVRFWGWVSRNCVDGFVPDVSLDDVESVLNLPHFLHHLCDVGWLDFVETPTKMGLKIPNFDRHLSDGAKKRALETRKKQQQRVTAKRVPQVSPKKRDKIGTTAGPEKRREENIYNVRTLSVRPKEKDKEEIAQFAKATIEEIGYSGRLPDEDRRLAYIAAVLEHTALPGKVADLRDQLRRKMRGPGPPSKPWAYFRSALVGECQTAEVDFHAVYSTIEVPGVKTSN